MIPYHFGSLFGWPWFHGIHDHHERSYHEQHHLDVLNLHVKSCRGALCKRGSQEYTNVLGGGLVEEHLREACWVVAIVRCVTRYPKLYSNSRKIACMHAYIQTNKQTYIHTYIHTWIVNIVILQQNLVRT